MAPTRHNLSRRAVLGAGVVVPVILAGAVGGASAGEGGGPSRLAPGGTGPAEALASTLPGGCEALAPAPAGRKAEALRLGWARALGRYQRAEAALDECRAQQAAL